MNRISRKFVKLMENSQMTPEEAAKNLEVDLLTVSKWESGEEPVPAEAVQHLLKLVNARGNGVPSYNSKTKYLICTIILGALLLCGLILNFTIKPKLVEQWTSRDYPKICVNLQCGVE